MKFFFTRGAVWVARFAQNPRRCSPSCTAWARGLLGFATHVMFPGLVLGEARRARRTLIP